jgi:hypothetical protein
MLPLGFFALGGAELIIVMVIMLFAFPLWIVPAILSYIVLERIPVEDRKQDPGLALLLLIPIFSLIWAFFVYPRISASLESYFARRGDRAEGDCGRTVALVLCICSLIPFVQIIALVCMVVFFVKVFSLTGRIERPRPVTVGS